MEKLQAKYLAPYLPHRLKFMVKANGQILEMTSLNLRCVGIYKLEDIKPIFRPFSDLTKEIEVNGKTFIPKNILDKTHIVHWSYININRVNSEMLKDAPSWFVNKLIEWNFDVFGLIDLKIAESIHDVDKLFKHEK